MGHNTPRAKEYDKWYRSQPHVKAKARLATAKYRASKKGQEYHEKNKDQKKEYNKAYYKLDKAQAYYKSEGRKLSIKNRKSIWYNVPKNRIKELVKAAKLRCFTSGQEIDTEYMDTLHINVPTACVCCKTTFDFSARRKNTPSLDRVDNSKGYTKDNVKIICNTCNSNKSNMNTKDLINLLNYMSYNPQAPMQLW